VRRTIFIFPREGAAAARRRLNNMNATLLIGFVSFCVLASHSDDVLDSDVVLDSYLLPPEWVPFRALCASQEAKAKRLPELVQNLQSTNKQVGALYSKVKAELVLGLPNTAYKDWRWLVGLNPNGLFSPNEIPVLWYMISYVRAYRDKATFTVEGLLGDIQSSISLAELSKRGVTVLDENLLRRIYGVSSNSKRRENIE